MSTQRLEPADVVLVCLLGAGLGADYPLIKNGFASVSERAGATKVRRAIVLYFACHFLRQPWFLRRFDPLSLISKWLRWWFTRRR